MKLVIAYLFCINLLSFALMGIDKSAAKKEQWRIPEKTLFSAAAAGGGIGGLLGMLFFHHKTKHLRFKIGFPFIIAAHLFVLALLIMP